MTSGIKTLCPDSSFQLKPIQCPDNGTGFLRIWPASLPLFQVTAASRYEYDVLQQLQGAQVPLSAKADPQDGDEAGRTLFYGSQLRGLLSDLKPDDLEFSDKLRLAIGLTRALSSLHERDVFHLSLRPAAFLVSEDYGRAEVIALDSARYCARSNAGISARCPAFYDPHYLAPEQSYPIDRLMDNRTDLYSLGALLVWLFYGRPPFAACEGEYAIAYGHISGQLMLPPTEDSMEAALQHVLRLMLEKEPDHRYQSCAGVLHDLETIYQALSRNQRNVQLEPRDISDRLHIPQKLYGRGQETQSLLAAFERVAEGRSEALLVGGYSGVGKSALLHEVHRPILRANGLFISGKFDQYQRGTPYSALVQAFNHFIRYLLSLPDDQVEQWRQRLNSALAPNAQVLVDIMPELTLLLGPQPALPTLGAEEQQNRFNRTFLQFVAEICSSHKPLVIFIDDLQWADLASINLLRLILSDRDSRHCLLLGAYRDNEVDEKHPFIRMLSDLDDQSQISHLTLQPLGAGVIQHLVADALQQSRDEVAELSALIYQKTAGNPFFFRQFMQELYQRELIRFDYNNYRWQWSMAAIAGQGITDNVVDLMLAKIDRLPVESANLLCQAACIGAEVEVSLLGDLNNLSSSQLEQRLQPVLDAGLLLPLNPEGIKTQLGALAGAQQMRFLHDRVQQAAYSKLCSQQQVETHYQLGLLLLASLDDAGIENRCFELVGHLNQAHHLLDLTQQSTLVKLNLRAARKAKAATAYSTAVAYLEQLFRLTTLDAADADCALADPATITDASIEKLECLYLAGNYAEAEAFKPVVAALCDSEALQVALNVILITQYTRYGELERGISQALLALEQLGWPLPAEPDMAVIGEAIAEARQNLSAMPFAKLAEQSAVADVRVLRILDILMAMQPCCYNSGSLLFPLTILGLLKLTMQHGNSPYSSYVYMMYGLMCTKVLKDYDTAFEAARYSDEIARAYPANPLLEGRLLMMRSNFILPWQGSLADSAGVRENAYHHCLEQGDYYWGVHSYIFGFYAELFSSASLDELLQRTEQVVTTCEQINQPAQVYLSTLQCNLLRILQGTLDNSRNLDHQPGYEAQAQQHFVSSNYMCGRYDRLLGRLLQGYLLGNYQAALDVSLAADLTPSDLDEGIFHEAVYSLFNQLCLLALQLQTSTEPDERLQQWQQQAWQRYQQWYQLNPQTFAPGYYLILAEQAQLAGDQLEACCHYERAIHHAQQNGSALLQALAADRCARYRIRLQQTSMARAYLEQAQELYHSWGALAKAEEMEQLLGGLSGSQRQAAGQSIDWSAILEASQDLSGRFSTAQLSQRMLSRAGHISGARQVAFFSRTEDGWAISALRSGDRAIEDPSASTIAPLGILNYSFNSRKTLVLKDAAHWGDYMLEPDVQQRQVRSVLSIPLQVQDQFIGVLYLEHDASSNLFSARKVRVLELLATQFATSYLNAGYYEQLEQYNARLEGVVEDRTLQLNKQNRHLNAVLASLPIPYVISDGNGELVEANELFLRRFELTREQFHRSCPADFYVDPADHQRMLSELIERGELHDFECELKTFKGERFWSLFSVTEIELENGTGIFGAITDISCRKAMEYQLHKQASTDPLTGAFNRRAFFALPEQLHPGAATSYCIAMLDLDHFKRLNDCYGHAAGDEVLKSFVDTVQHSLREGDLLARLGGEEFGLLLPQVDLAQAEDIMQRICQRVAALEVAYQQHAIRFTTSVGLVAWQPDESLADALSRADQQLYDAKSKGRNRVESEAVIPGSHLA